ncbi:MAG: hypothetical protein U0R24_10620 [Solirubrobacterales bacterium]
MTPSRLAAALLVAVALLAAGCGDDEESTAGAPLGADDWRARAEQYCSDAYQEATALPLPGKLSQVAQDASSRAEILATVRDGILTLGQPDGIDSDDVSAYVDALNADIAQLGQIADAAEDGTLTSELAQLDEAAGQAAATIELDNCAALSQAIARTP